MTNKNSQKEIASHPFFYKDGLTVLNHLTKLDDNYLRDTSEIVNSKDKHQNLESSYKIDDTINQRVITQLEEENQSLFQMTKIQQQKIEHLLPHRLLYQPPQGSCLHSQHIPYPQLYDLYASLGWSVYSIG